MTFMIQQAQDGMIRYLFIVLIIALASVQYKLWYGEGSIHEWLTLKHKISAQIHENEVLESQNQALLADIQELKSADQALEEDARQNLGMIKNDETYFQIIEDKEPPHDHSKY
jgi:cell division protein FtsB